MPCLAGQKKHDILMHSSGRLMKNVHFFSKIPSILLLKIVSCLKKEIFLTNDVITKSDQTCERISINIHEPTVALFVIIF